MNTGIYGRWVYFNGNAYMVKQMSRKWNTNGRRSYGVEGVQGTFAGPGERRQYYPRKWYLPKRLTMPCEFCGTTENVTVEVDPYEADVHNTIRTVNACERCLTERAADV